MSNSLLLEQMMMMVMVMVMVMMMMMIRLFRVLPEGLLQLRLYGPCNSSLP